MQITRCTHNTVTCCSSHCNIALEIAYASKGREITSDLLRYCITFCHKTMQAFVSEGHLLADCLFMTLKQKLFMTMMVRPRDTKVNPRFVTKHTDASRLLPTRFRESFVITGHMLLLLIKW